MNALKIILLVLLLLICFLIVLGLVKSTLHYGHEITVNKPIEEAWSVHQDPAKLELWLDGFKSIEHLSGTKHAVGSTYKVIVHPSENEPEFEMIETINSVKAFDHINLNMDSKMMSFDQTTSFEQVNEKTTNIKTASQVTGKGFMMKVMFAAMDLFTDSFQKQEEKNIEALKRVIESNTKDYFKNDTSETVKTTMY